MQSETLERYLALEGTYNLRDIGGYVTEDGRQIRWRTVFRSGVLDKVPGTTIQAMVDYGIKTVIDLRRPVEITDAPSVFAVVEGVNYLHLPLIDEQSESALADDLPQLYKILLDNHQTQISRVLASVADENNLPLLINCTGGKDRTGIIIALLLANAGVPAEVIAEDYALSHQYLLGLFEELRLKAQAAKYDMSRYERMLGSDKAFMLATLAYLTEKYSSVQVYLEQTGLTSEQISTLKEVLVVHS